MVKVGKYPLNLNYVTVNGPESRHCAVTIPAAIPGSNITIEEGIAAGQESERLWKHDPEGFRRQSGKQATK